MVEALLQEWRGARAGVRMLLRELVRRYWLALRQIGSRSKAGCPGNRYRLNRTAERATDGVSTSLPCAIAAGLCEHLIGHLAEVAIQIGKRAERLVTAGLPVVDACLSRLTEGLETHALPSR